MNRRSLINRACLLAAGALTLPAALAEPKPDHDVAWEWGAMGSHFRAYFQLPVGKSQWDFIELKKEVEELLLNLEKIFSVHRPDSEALTLCRLANASPGEFFEVSEELYKVTQQALAYTQVTRGHFDITFGALTSYWRYCKVSGTLPDPARIAILKQRIGAHQVILKEGGISFQPADRQVLLDYGGIAKGDAVDRALRLFRKHGISSAVFDLGGEIAALKPPRGKAGWEVAILGPDGETAVELVMLAERALSTSGDLYQSISHGKNYHSHVVNSKMPAGLRDKRSVTVLSKSGISADCLSTAAHSAVNTDDFDGIKQACEKIWVY